MYKGLIYNLTSNIVFFLGGYVLHFFLGNTLSPINYGIIGTITTVLDFEYMFLSNGARQSLSKELSRKYYQPKDLIKKSIVFQLILVTAFFSINYYGAGFFASVLKDSSLTKYFKVASFLIPANGIYVLVLGINDGLQEFGKSAFISTLYPIIKLSAIPFILFVFSDPIIGMQMGFLLALLISICIGFLGIIKDRKKFNSTIENRISFVQVAHNTLGFSFFFIVVSLVLSMDTLVVKSVVVDKSMAGYYTGAVNFAKLSYFLLTACFTVILPVVSNLFSENNYQKAIKSISDTLVLIFTFITPITMLISAGSGFLMTNFYTSAYIKAAFPLALLAISHFFMGLTVFFNMVLSSLNKSRFSTNLSLITLAICLPLFIVAARLGGINLISLASVSATFLTLIASVIAVRKQLGPFISQQIWKLIAFNLLFWLVLRLIFNWLIISNLVYVVAIFGVFYLLFLLALHLSKVIDLKEIVTSFIK